jgi:hypothetical protein
VESSADLLVFDFATTEITPPAVTATAPPAADR